MSWFNASHLSSFAKQALTSAQKSIDRVLDIKEVEQWGDTHIPYHDVPVQPSVGVGWGVRQWDSPPQECTHTVPQQTDAITTPVTRTVVDESENFFSSFLSTDVAGVPTPPVVSVPPTKSSHMAQSKSQPDTVDQDSVCHTQAPLQPGKPEEQTLEPKPAGTADVDPERSPSLGGSGDTSDPEASTDFESHAAETCEDALADSQSVHAVDGSPSTPAKPAAPKHILLECKDPKSEDRQSDTPSPPVSTFSSGTSTTSDIEVLDHESVLSESSAETKASLQLMQSSFQLLSSSSACVDGFPKLTESCSSSDAFERIDSFSVQSLDSRSVSEINSDDELPGRTLASVTAGPTTPVPDITKEHEENEMEESGRSATPVNIEQSLEIMQPQPPEEPCTPASGAEGTERSICTEPTGSDTSNHDLQQIIDHLRDRLDKRESQLLMISKDKARLEEECDNLKDEMVRVEEESSSVQMLKDEFTQRIAEAERKAQQACKERDMTKKDMKSLREELSTRLNSNETLEIIKEKEEQIRGLLEEGEKLSKQQLQHTNIIKKLRVKEKENESLMSKQSKKIKEQEEDITHLQQVLDGKEDLEKQHRENIRKLNAVVEKQERDIGSLQGEVDEMQEKNRSLQVALDNAYKEVAELHKANATKASEAQEAALSLEIQAKEQISLALEKVQEESRLQQEALANQIADLRLALQRAEQQQARKEDYLREEISELQQRLQGAETRNQELSQSVTTATRPLLRQIENLQATLASQTASWEKLEKNISDRLADAQAQLAVAVERERSTCEELLTVRAQMASQDSQNSLLRQEKGRLQGQLDMEKSRREKLEDDRSRERVELENLRGEHKRLLEESKKEKLLLNNQLEMEKMKVEQEKKKCYLAQEALKEKERKAGACEAAGVSSPSLSRCSSISGGEFGLQISVQDDGLDHSLSALSASASTNTLYEAARLGGSNIIESLQSQLKLREGEIAQLQLEISSLERSRAVMTEELVKLTNQNDEMEEKVQEIPRLRVQLKELEQRHNTILQMYGEKAEEAEELRLDLEDVKIMYKTQIDELLKNQK